MRSWVLKWTRQKALSRELAELKSYFGNISVELSEETYVRSCFFRLMVAKGKSLYHGRGIPGMAAEIETEGSYLQRMKVHIYMDETNWKCCKSLRSQSQGWTQARTDVAEFKWVWTAWQMP